MGTTILVIDFLAEVILSGSLLGLLAIIWKASARFTRLEVSLEEIKSNHLPHLYEELRLLRHEMEEQNGYNKTRNH